MKSNAAVAVTPINLKIGALVPRSQRELTVRSKFTLEKELDCGLAIVRCGLVEREFGDHIARLNGFIGVPIPVGFSHSCKRAVHCDGTSADMIVTQDSSATTSSADDHDATLVPISSYSLTVSAATKRTCAPEARDDRTLSFPVKLHLILNDNNDTISWNASGRFFVVHKPSEFLAKVIPKWFQHSKLASFQRQLKVYGFTRLPCDQNKGAYFHRYFQRDRPDLAPLMMRTLHRVSEQQKATAAVQRILKPIVPAEMNSKQLDATFPARLYVLLHEAQVDGLNGIASWAPHGRCFAIHQPDAFMHHLMPRYFVRSERASFHHQLHQYGFARLTLGQDAGSFYHEHFLRGNPTLAEYMGRVYTPQIGHRDNCESVQTVGYNALVHRAPAHSVSYASFESQTWTNTAISKVEARFADNEDDTGTAALSALEDVIDKVFFDRDGVEDDMLCDFCGEWSKAL